MKQPITLPLGFLIFDVVLLTDFKTFGQWVDLTRSRRWSRFESCLVSMPVFDSSRDERCQSTSRANSQRVDNVEINKHTRCTYAMFIEANSWNNSLAA